MQGPEEGKWVRTADRWLSGPADSCTQLLTQCSCTPGSCCTNLQPKTALVLQQAALYLVSLFLLLFFFFSLKRCSPATIAWQVSAAHLSRRKDATKEITWNRGILSRPQLGFRSVKKNKQNKWQQKRKETENLHNRVRFGKVEPYFFCTFLTSTTPWSFSSTPPDQWCTCTCTAFMTISSSQEWCKKCSCAESSEPKNLFLITDACFRNMIFIL